MRRRVKESRVKEIVMGDLVVILKGVEGFVKGDYVTVPRWIKSAEGVSFLEDQEATVMITGYNKAVGRHEALVEVKDYVGGFLTYSTWDLIKKG